MILFGAGLHTEGVRESNFLRVSLILADRAMVVLYLTMFAVDNSIVTLGEFKWR